MLRLGLSVAPGLVVKGLQLITPSLLIIHPGCHPDRSAWRMFVATENLWRGVEGSRGSLPDHAATGSSFRELSFLLSHLEKHRHLASRRIAPPA